MLNVNTSLVLKEARKLLAERKLAIKSKRNIQEVKLLLLKQRYGL